MLPLDRSTQVQASRYFDLNSCKVTSFALCIIAAAVLSGSLYASTGGASLSCLALPVILGSSIYCCHQKVSRPAQKLTREYEIIVLEPNYKRYAIKTREIEIETELKRALASQHETLIRCDDALPEWMTEEFCVQKMPGEVNADQYSIKAKIKSSEGGHTEYEDGVVEELVPVEGKAWASTGWREFPDGTREVGTFHIGEGFRNGSRFTKNKTTYLTIDRFGHSFKMQDRTLQFAEVLEKDGTPTLKVIEETKGDIDSVYTPYTGSLSLEEILFSDKKTSALCAILQHPRYENFFDRKQILQKLLTEKRERLPLIKQKVGYYAPQVSGLPVILSAARELGLKADLHTPFSSTQDNLIEVMMRDISLGSKEGHSIARKALDDLKAIDPLCVTHIVDGLSIWGREWALGGDEKRLAFYREILKESQASPTEKDLQLEKVYTNAPGFTDEEFRGFDHSFQQTIYQIANDQNHLGLVRRLNQLGMRRESFAVDKRSILGGTMDLETIQDRVSKYLQDLRRQGRILTKSEFKRLYPDYRTHFIAKRNQVHRMIGTDYLAKSIKKLGLTYPKVPFTIAVIPDKQENLSIKREFPGRCAFEIEDFELWAERVSKDWSQPSFDQMKQVVDLIEETGYLDIGDHNIFADSQAAYFIDNKLSSFRPVSNEHYSSIQENLFDRDSQLDAYLQEKVRKLPRDEKEKEPTLDAGYRWNFHGKQKPFSLPIKKIMDIPYGERENTKGSQKIPEEK